MYDIVTGTRKMFCSREGSVMSTFDCILFSEKHNKLVEYRNRLAF